MRRDRIRARPRTFYANLLERLNRIPQEEPAPAFALEHSWHAIFVSASTNAKLYQRPCCRVCSRGAFPGCILKLARVCTSGWTEWCCRHRDYRASPG